MSEYDDAAVELTLWFNEKGIDPLHIMPVMVQAMAANICFLEMQYHRSAADALKLVNKMLKNNVKLLRTMHDM